MKLLDDFFEIRKKIHDHFGYVEDWVVIPLDDAREYFWYEDGSQVRFADSEEELFDEDEGNYYEHEIYTQRHLPKWVYRTDDYTMICVDTNADGNHFLQIFDNTKERVPMGEEITK